MPRKASEVEAEVRESAHKVWLAGLGALALAQDGAGKLFETLVSRGKDVETRGSGMLKDARGKVEDAWKKVGKEMDEQVVAVLHRVGVPSREDIATLNRRVEHLTASIEQLKSKPASARSNAERRGRASIG